MEVNISESHFQTKVINYLKSKGCYVIKYWGGGKFTKAGVPDLLVCCNGIFLGIELKAPNGKPSKLQLYNLDQIKKSGGIGILLYPKDFNKFKTRVEEICNTPIQE
ncbi:VRR-NUC domain-containing protein [Helcococcus kunzii]|uniref:VRR-NUC domain-containing protein n=1 Tax=Helcococcus kunzii TaxID=40091 RepID=UPI0024AE07A7|nr:VRR-NUC domain-containing protein [Helcococcus kunzii]